MSLSLSTIQPLNSSTSPSVLKSHRLDRLIHLLLQRSIRIGVAGEHDLEQLSAVRSRQDAGVHKTVERVFRILTRRDESNIGPLASVDRHDLLLQPVEARQP